MTCYGIDNEQIGKGSDWNQRCVIYARTHKFEDHLCGVTNYHKRIEKPGIYIKVKFANCERGYSANSNWYIQKYKVEIDARKNKLLSKGKAKINEICLNLSDVSPKSKSSSKTKASHKSKTSPEHDASLNLDKVIFKLDIEMNLAPK